MSTATVTPPAPEVTIENTAAEILAAHTAEKNSAAAPPAAAVEAPTVPPPAPVEPAKPYNITTNPDGTVKLDFITDKGVKETFTGTNAEVLEKLAASKASGDDLIRKFQTATPATETPAAPAAPVTTPQGWMPAPEVAVNAVNDMISNGNMGGVVGIGLAQMFGANDPAQVVAVFNDLISLSAEVKAQKAMSDFASKAPDFPWSEANGKLLVTELTNRGMPMTTDNMVFAYHALKGAGVLQAAQGQPAVAGTPPPAPPRQGAAPPSATDYDPWAVPLDQLEANIRAGR
jgi:hypothetical protein